MGVEMMESWGERRGQAQQPTTDKQHIQIYIQMWMETEKKEIWKKTKTKNKSEQVHKFLYFISVNIYFI